MFTDRRDAGRLLAELVAELNLTDPVAPADALEEIGSLADDVVVVQTPEQFWAIGQFYVDFHQLSDDETVTLLNEAWARP